MGDLVTVKIEGIRTHITSIDVTLDKLSTSFEALVRLEEKYLAHVKEDDLIHASVKTDSQRLTLLELQVGPLIEMRRWIIAGAVGVVHRGSVVFASGRFAVGVVCDGVRVGVLCLGLVDRAVDGPFVVVGV